MKNVRARVLLSLLLALVLVVTMSPLAYAATPSTLPSDEDSLSTGFADGLASSSDSGNSFEGGGSDSGLPDLSGLLPDTTDTEDEPADTAPQDDEDASLEPTATLADYNTSITPIAGGTKARVVVANVANLIRDNAADRMVVTATLSYNGKVIRTVTGQSALSALAANSNSFTMDCANYGSFSVTPRFYKGPTLVRTEAARTVNISANEYNIAPLSGTLPVTLFSLQLWGAGDLRHDTSGNLIPTIAVLQRPNSWNWSNLPTGVYGLPYLTDTELRYQPAVNQAIGLFWEHSQVMTSYVASLYKINPSAKFNIFVNDYDLGLINHIIYVNKIPQSQYSITVITDGSFSYVNWNNVYGSASNPQSIHNSKKSAWASERSKEYSTGAVSSDFQYDRGRSYDLAVVDWETNAKYWLVRPQLFISNKDGDAFGASIRAKTSKIVPIAVNTLLTAITAEGQGSVSEFKALYNFNDSYFAEAEAAGKDPLVFLGTYHTLEGPFGDFAHFVQAYYGDEFVYYYKGHPAFPTAMYPEKQKQLDKLGITDIDSSIAAELFLFFNVNVKLAGYGSTTYDSVTDSDMCRGLFLMPPTDSKAKALASDPTRYAKFDFFIAEVNANTDSRARALTRPNMRSYLVEFSDSVATSKGYSIAIWEPDATYIRYYRLQGSSYVFVSETIGSRLVTISAAAAPNQLIDIAGRDTQAGGKSLLWSSHRGANQRFVISQVGPGYYSIMNVNSGMVLDVERASKKAGTPIIQYPYNGGDNQLWRLVPTGDASGSYYIVSKHSGLYLDMNGGATANGTALQIWPSNGRSSQKFLLNDILPTIDEGNYAITSVLSGQSLDINGASTKDGATAITWPANNNANQQFTLTFDHTTGYYAIQAAHSGRFLDVIGASKKQGTQVIQWKANGGLNQLWDIVPLGDGHYRIVAAHSGLALDVAKASKAAGASVIVWPWNAQNNQKWLLAAL